MPGPRPAGGRERGQAGQAEAHAAKLNAELARGLFCFLDANGDGLVEEHEWEIGCKESRSFFRPGQSQPKVVSEIFDALDSKAVGSLVLEDVKDEVASLCQAMGIPTGQGHEALHILQERRAKAAKQREAVRGADSLASMAAAAAPDAQSAPQSALDPARGDNKTAAAAAAAARVCSDRRAQVLRRFLGVLQPEADEAESATEEPLAIRAKRAARAVVAGGSLPAPPPELDISFGVDALHAGGDSVWVSVEVAVAKGDGADPAAGAADSEPPHAQRVPADLLIVVDVSGSMHTALPNVRKCLASLSTFVSPEDRLALVKFDNTADVVMPWTPMDESGLKEFCEKQKELVSRGGTCFLPFFEKCFEHLLKDDAAGRARTVLFISDGAPDEREGDILRDISSRLKAPNLSLVAAGFGSGTQAPLMSAIAQCGCGPFVYIPEASDIPQQLGRIWAAVAHTSLSAAYAVLRPLGGARVAAVEGAFGAAELSLRPDGQPSNQQVLVVQLGPVRHGASREVVVQLRLPPHLVRGKVEAAHLRQPLLEVSVLSQAVAPGNPVFLQKSDFLVMQVPSLLMDNLLPFPVRIVLDNDLDEFDLGRFMKGAAEAFGVEQHELELTRLLRGSIIIDLHLKMELERAAQVLENIVCPDTRRRMGDAMERAGWKLKSMNAPGQHVFRRLLQTRFAGALGAAATSKDAAPCIELRGVQMLSKSDLAQCLDPPGPASLCAKVSQDCETVIERLRKVDDQRAKRHLGHELVQLQAAHLAQYKCQAVMESLDVYRQPEAEDAAQAMETACGNLSLSTAFWDTVSPSIEVATHESVEDQSCVLLSIRPKTGKEVDFNHLAKQVCPVFEVGIWSAGSCDAAPRREALAHAYPAVGRLARPIVRRSQHPCAPGCSTDDSVLVPFATSLRLRVDPRSCTRDGSLTFYADAERTRPIKAISQSLGRSAGRSAPDAWWEMTVDAAQVWYRFRPSPDPCCSAEWGYHFEVEAALPTDVLPGVLLQAGVVGVRPGNSEVTVRPVKHVLEVPPARVAVRELHGTAEERRAALRGCHAAANARLVMEGCGLPFLGVAAPVRLLCADGEMMRKRESLSCLADLQEEGGSVTLAFTADPEILRANTSVLAKTKFQPVPAETLKSIDVTAQAVFPAPRQPELVDWSWDGDKLRLSWRHGWPFGTCALEASVDWCTPLVGTPIAAGNYYWVSKEERFEHGERTCAGSPGPRDRVRCRTFDIPGLGGAAIRLDLRLYPGHACPPEDRTRCRLGAWLVPRGDGDSLRRLLAGEGAKDLRVWDGPLATLVAEAARAP